MAVEQTGGTPEQHRHAAYQFAEKMGLWEKLKDDPNVDTAVFQNYENVKNTLKGIKPTGKKSKLKAKKKGVAPEEDKELIHIITGGEEGIPSWFSREAEKRGITSVQLIHPQQKTAFGKGTLTEQISLDIETLSEANHALRKAADKLNVNIANFDEFSTEALKRDYLKAKHANTVFVFDTISNDRKTVNGYSKYASQMALDMAKPMLSQPRDATGYDRQYIGLWKVVLDMGVSQVTHDFDGDIAFTHVAINAPRALHPGGAAHMKPKAGFVGDSVVTHGALNDSIGG